MTPNRAELEALARRVLDRIRDELAARGSGLVADGALAIGIEPQARSILAEALLAVDAGLPAADLVTVDYRDADLLAKGRALAQRDFDPAEPLVVGELLFGVALPELARLLPGADPIALARALHHAIWRRFPIAAVSYVELLREQLRRTESSAREQLARELHDRIAHDLLAGVQRLELARLAPDDAAELDETERRLRAVLDEVRRLAHDLRIDTAGRALDEALDELVARDPDPGLPLRRTVEGEPLALTPRIVAECTAIVAEAVRNARRHARAASGITIATRWRADALVVEVVDDGGGAAADRAPGGRLGIAGMRERAERIGGAVEVGASAGGTEVRLVLPFGGRAHADPAAGGAG